MKLLQLITRAEHGGAQAHLADLLAGFKGDFELALAVGEEGFLTDRARALELPVYLVPDLVQPVAPSRDVRAVRQVRRVLDDFKPDLIHCHSSKAGFVGRLAASAAGVPAIFTAHGWSFAEGVSWRRKSFAVPSEWLTARLGQKIITVSEQDRKLALRYGVARADDLMTVHNGVPDTPYRALPNCGEPVRIAMVARFAPPKDHLLLLQALKNSASVALELVLIGDGPTRSLVEDAAGALGLGARVSFLGTRSESYGYARSGAARPARWS